MNNYKLAIILLMISILSFLGTRAAIKNRKEIDSFFGNLPKIAEEVQLDLKGKFSRPSSGVEVGKDIKLIRKLNFNPGLKLDYDEWFGLSEIADNKIYVPYMKVETEELIINVFRASDGEFKEKIIYDIEGIGGYPLIKVIKDRIYLVNHSRKSIEILNLSGKHKKRISLSGGHRKGSSLSSTRTPFDWVPLYSSNDHIYLLNIFGRDRKLQKYDFRGDILKEVELDGKYWEEVTSAEKLLFYKGDLYFIFNEWMNIVNQDLEGLGSYKLSGDDFGLKNTGYNGYFTDYVFYRNRFIYLGSNYLVISDLAGDYKRIPISSLIGGSLEGLLQTKINRYDLELRSNNDRLFLLDESQNLVYELEINENICPPVNSKNWDRSNALFPDIVLEHAIRRRINKPKGELSNEDIKSIERLSIRNQGIQNLQGLKKLKNLRVLRLPDNQEDISLLLELPNLEKVYLDEDALDFSLGSIDYKVIKKLQSQGVEIHL
ncbi:hypothetical protein [Halanaerobacter jeridensis]|uniref:Leucine-rich repeat (LRR) protein n=1 Tax=Halanaerobacter jeridensis TaxID=706427 RepID=A0A938XV57_9FIRM|nr:hypothetical protein [Halanaerobacter jeridensis]MBM7556157.1 Leucine-rich repeat (LRR) protein [Halanaerobacter jeridensis]